MQSLKFTPVHEAQVCFATTVCLRVKLCDPERRVQPVLSADKRQRAPQKFQTKSSATLRQIQQVDVQRSFVAPTGIRVAI